MKLNLRIKRMTKRALTALLATVLSMIGLTVSSVCGQDSQLSAIRQQFADGEFARVIASYTNLPGDLRESPIVCSWVGQSYLHQHDIEHAQQYLLKATAGNLAPVQRQRAQAQLERVSTLKQLCPPVYHEYKLDGYTIRIFAKDSPWVASIAAQMPTFLARAKEAFGSTNTYVAFYLFEDRASYSRFFEAWGAVPPGKEHRGTGCMQMVEFCRYFPNGTEIGGTNVSELFSRVLHEYSHALCNTIYGDKFKMPPWLNEGMADYFGWKYNALGARQAQERLQRLASQRRAFSYEELSSAFHTDNQLGYATADVLVSTLLKGKPLSIYAQIINLARSSDGNFDYAIQKATGLDPRAVYSQTVSIYWKKKAEPST